jgi:beta-xylosidase
LIKSSAISQAYSAESRKFTGISSMASSPGGRLWATWYAGITPGEDKNNYVVVATSADKGETWEEVLVIDPIHDQVRAYDPELWVDPDGKLWVFWAQATYIGGTWMIGYGRDIGRSMGFNYRRIR